MGDPTGEHFVMTSFPRTHGNLGIQSDDASNDVTGNNAVGILGDVGDDLRIRPGFRTDRWAAGSHQFSQHGFSQLPVRDMIPQQVENS